MMWEIKNSANAETEAADTLDIYIYSDIGESWFDDDAMGGSKFQKELAKHPDAKNINIYINSYGGSVSEGVAIYNQLKRHKGYVTAYVDGFACSIASVIPMAADKVVMSECSMFMIHNPWTIEMGNAAQMRKCANDLDKMRDGCIIPAYRSKMKISDEKLIELMDSESWITPEEALEYGFCDEIAKTEKENPKDKYTEALDAAKKSFMNRFEQMFAKTMNPVSDSAEPEVKEQEPKPEEPKPDAEAETKKAEVEAEAKEAEKQAKIDEAKKQFLSYFKF